MSSPTTLRIISLCCTFPGFFVVFIMFISLRRINSCGGEQYTLSNKLWQGHKRRLKEHRAKGNGFGYSLFSRESKYTSTISARYYKDGSEILIEQKGKNPRKLTPREAARLQGFPDNFKIPVSDAQAYKQFGNSVAVPVVTAVAREMVKILDNPEKRIPYVKWKQLDLIG